MPQSFTTWSLSLSVKPKFIVIIHRFASLGRQNGRQNFLYIVGTMAEDDLCAGGSHCGRLHRGINKVVVDRADDEETREAGRREEGPVWRIEKVRNIYKARPWRSIWCSSPPKWHWSRRDLDLRPEERVFQQPSRRYGVWFSEEWRATVLRLWRRKDAFRQSRSLSQRLDLSETRRRRVHS